SGRQEWVIISRVSSWRLLVGDSIITPSPGTGVPGSVRSLAVMPGPGGPSWRWVGDEEVPADGGHLPGQHRPWTLARVHGRRMSYPGRVGGATRSLRRRADGWPVSGPGSRLRWPRPERRRARLG